MRIPTAFALVALGALLATGCKEKTTTGPRKPTKVSRVRTPRGLVAPAPTSFTIDPQDKKARTNTAAGVCAGIAAERKKRLEGLVHLLLNGTAQEKVKAAQMIGDLCDVMAVPFLMTRMKDESDRNVRLAAVTALGHIADPASAKVLVALLDDEDVGMAEAALAALTEMDEEELKKTGELPYAFVEGRTIKIRKKTKADWEKRLKEGYFDKK